MDYVMIARIFGPFMAIVGLWRLLLSDNFNKAVTSIKSNPGAFYLMSMIDLLIGLIVINFVNIWAWKPAVLLTIYGWLMTLRGVLGFFLPQAMYKFMTHRTFLKAWGIVPIIVGLILCWVGWVTHY